MMTLLQVAAAATGPSWQGIATIVIGAFQALLFWMLGQSSQDRREMRTDISALKDQVASLNAHVGVDGNGLLARFDKMESKIDAIFSHIMKGGA